jgi:nucleoside-diphosphate-sugar epimerase
MDGYVGWPTALKLARLYPDARIVGVDSMGRREWVREVGSVSAIPVASMEERLAAAREQGCANISFVPGDLADWTFTSRLFRIYRFDAVLHLAAQPSAPYSQIDGERAGFTQANNTRMLLNLLWALKESGQAESCLFVETTTTGVYGAPAFPIPEGFVRAEHKGVADTVPFGGMGGSWYHMSKSFDAGNLWLANRQWGLSVVDLRTSIVYGAATTETAADPRLATRFDFDFYYGIVLNRFCAMGLVGHPITIYGKGEQKKPFIALEDCAATCANAMRLERDGTFRVLNQHTQTVSIQELARAVRDAAAAHGVEVELQHIPNPRVEDEEHKMEMDNQGFLALMDGEPAPYRTHVEDMMARLVERRDVFRRYKDRFIR